MPAASKFRKTPPSCLVLPPSTFRCAGYHNPHDDLPSSRPSPVDGCVCIQGDSDLMYVVDNRVG